MRWNQYATKAEALADRSHRHGIPVTGQFWAAGPPGTSGAQWCIVPGEAPRRFHLVRRRAGTDLYYEAANDEWSAR
jgi:hypothetical protein